MDGQVHQLVWHKRDLRICDHGPLLAASRQGVVVPFYVIETAYWSLPDTSEFQWRFIQKALEALRKSYRALGTHLLIVQGDVVDFLSNLHQRDGVGHLWSHQETGNHWTYRRDQRVAAWCQQHDIGWSQHGNDGVIRGLQHRRGWAKQRDQQLNRSLHPSVSSLRPHGLTPMPHRAPSLPSIALHAASTSMHDPIKVLNGFLITRGRRYQFGMSSPNTAFRSCSRMSPYLAYGLISPQMIFHRCQSVLQDPAPHIGRRPIQAFLKRLFWRSHFMQKLETMPAIETQAMHVLYDDLHRDHFNETWFERWQQGTTGFPLVDACMRALQHHGWINFRMRAMLVSFASYQLWLDWRITSRHLANYFVDYEPGIHYSQFQMQSGVTGINLPRIYNPLKQSQDQDPHGHFIRRYLPELKQVPTPFIHTPWEMPPILQKEIGCVLDTDYPLPMVDLKASTQRAKEMIFSVRRSPEHHAIAQSVLHRLSRAT